jgi:arylsulfatase
MERTVAGRFGTDTFGVGIDTGAPVSNDYQPPFAVTGVIDRIELGDPGVETEEEAALHARFSAGKDY